MSPEKQPVRVVILGQAYTLLTTEDPRQVEAVASEVDELMLSIAGRQPNADSTRIAVLACLNLMGRLHALQRDLTDLRSRVGQKSMEFTELLERALGE